MKVLAVVQARMGSSRLPGKTLMDLEGKPVLGWMLDRLVASTTLDQVVVATSDLSGDDPICDYCKIGGYEFYRGDEKDVLKRFYDCSQHYGAEVLVRLTADCPLIDPVVVDQVVNSFIGNEHDYVANTLPLEGSTFPDGCDVEVFSRSALKKAYDCAVEIEEREHVTPYMRKPESGLKTFQVVREPDLSSFRYTLDTKEDLQNLKEISRMMTSGQKTGTMEEIVAFLEPHNYS